MIYLVIFSIITSFIINFIICCIIDLVAHSRITASDFLFNIVLSIVASVTITIAMQSLCYDP